jgi:hypothetical protein
MIDDEVNADEVFDSAILDGSAGDGSGTGSSIDTQTADQINDGDSTDDGNGLPSGSGGGQNLSVGTQTAVQDQGDDQILKLEKQVSDNKAWATRVAQENAELKRKFDELERESAQTVVPKDPPAVPDDIREYYENDPKLKDVIAYEASRLLAERFGDFTPESMDNRFQGYDNALAQLNFERGVTGGVLTDTGYVQGHPDAYQVMSSQGFREWMAVETVKDPSAGSVNDPVVAIGIIDRYKAHVAAALSAAEAVKKDEQAGALKDMMTGAVEKGNAVPPKAKKDPSPDEAFEEGIK